MPDDTPTAGAPVASAAMFRASAARFVIMAAEARSRSWDARARQLDDHANHLVQLACLLDGGHRFVHREFRYHGGRLSPLTFQKTSSSSVQYRVSEYGGSATRCIL